MTPIYAVLVSLLALGCSDKPAREPTLVRSQDCEDAYPSGICPGDVDCAWDERTGCQICTCLSDERKIDSIPFRENMR